jgi:hypothetical protein
VLLPALQDPDSEEQQKASKLYDAHDTVLFVKDVDNKVYHRSNGPVANKAKFQKMLGQSQRYGFSCGMRIQQEDPETLALNMGDKHTLGTYVGGPSTLQEYADYEMRNVWNITIGKSKKVDDKQKELPIFMPLCLGGHFMATIDRILQAPVVDWKGVVESVRRKPNNERFMERIWALLLSAPIALEEQVAIRNQEYRILTKGKKPRYKYQGLITIKKRYEPPMPARKKRGWKQQREPFLIRWIQQEELLKRHW